MDWYGYNSNYNYNHKKSNNKPKEKPKGKPLYGSSSIPTSGLIYGSVYGGDYNSMFRTTSKFRTPRTPRTPGTKESHVSTRTLRSMVDFDERYNKPKVKKELTEEEKLAKEQQKIEKRVDQQVDQIKRDLKKQITELSDSEEIKYIDVQVRFSNKCGCNLRWLCKQQEGECETSAKQYLRGPDDLKHGSVTNPDFDPESKDKTVKKFKYDVSKKVFKKLLNKGYNVVYVRKCVQIGEDHDGKKRKFWAIFAFDNYFRFYLNEDED